MAENTLQFILDKLVSWQMIVIIFLILFRVPIVDLFKRIIKLKVGNDFCLEAADVGQSSKYTDKGISDIINSSERDESMFALHPLVQKKIESINVDINKLFPDEDKNKINKQLVHALASAILLLTAEKIYRTIFGSQIKLLKYLNVCGPQQKNTLISFYDTAKSESPAVYSNYTYDQYLQFLSSFNLIVVNEDANYCITEEGKAFLEWIVTMSVSENKPH